MSLAWEITPEDVETVLRAHHIPYTPELLDEILGQLNHEEIIEELLFYTSMNEQTDSMLCDIEDFCQKNGYLPGTSGKLFLNPEDEDYVPEEIDEDWDEEDDYDDEDEDEDDGDWEDDEEYDDEPWDDDEEFDLDDPGDEDDDDFDEED